MAGYRNYLLVVLGAYVLLILLLHIQLQGFDNRKAVYSVGSEHESSRRMLNHGVMSVDSNGNRAQQNSWPLRFHTLDKPAAVKSDPISNDDTNKEKKNPQADSNSVHARWKSHFIGPLGEIPNINRETATESIEQVVSNTNRKFNQKAGQLDQYMPLDIEKTRLDDQTLRHDHHHDFLQPTPKHCEKRAQVTPGGSMQPLYKHFIYSAYYDGRDPGSPVIRVMVLLHKINKPTLYCQFKLRNSITQDTNATHFTVKAQYYEMCENHAKEYGGWILSCNVPYSIQEMPCSIKIGVFPKESDSLQHRKIQYSSVEVPVFTLGTNKSEDKYDFGVCIPPLFGNIPSMTLINFIELTRLLGADHLVFYNYQVSSEIRQVLKYYQDLGFISVIKWTIPIKEKSIWYHGQLAAINDCLYRSMHGFKYVAFNDIDEYIIPRTTKHWPSLVNLVGPIETHSNHCCFSFQSAFFDPNILDTKPVVYDLETDLRTKVISKVRTKVLVNPRRVFELGIHHVSRTFSKKHKVIYVEPKVALLHHYRKCTADFDPHMNCQIYVKDESLSGFIPSLRYQVHQTLWQLKQRAEDKLSKS